MAKKEKGNRYATYLRCSTDDQKQGDFTTIDTQRDINEHYVAELGGILVREYSDEGRTGTNLKRPGWEQLLKDARAGAFDVVCATYMSRLARGKTYYIAEYLLNESGVKVALVREKFTPDLAGHVNREMTVLMDGMYPKMVAQWTSAKMEQMVAQGYFCGGTIPFGFTSVPIEGVRTSGDKPAPRRLVINEPEAEVVRHAYSLYVQTGTILRVQEYLRNVTSRKWVPSTVKRMLRNCGYIGVQVFGEWRNETGYPVIIDADTWKEVQERLDVSEAPRISGGRIVRVQRSDDYTYYLHGLVSCPHCDCNYSNSLATGRSGSVYYYECLHGKKHISKCPVQRINANALHETVFDLVKSAVKHKAVMLRMLRESDTWGGADDSLKDVRGQCGKKLQFTNLQIGNITKAIANGRALDSLLDTLEKLESEKQRVTEQIAQLDKQIRAATCPRPVAAEVQRAWSKAIDVWKEATEPERAAVMQALVSNVRVDSKTSVRLKLRFTETLFTSTIKSSHEGWFGSTAEIGSGDWI